jgi:hypothetical protein
MATVDGPVLRLGGGMVLLSGSALLEVVRALSTAQLVARRDGISPHAGWRWIHAELAAEAACITSTTAARGSAAVPHPGDPALSCTDLVDTKEAAQMLDCQPRNVRDLCSRGVLDTARMVGGRLLIERLEVEAEVTRRAEVRRTQERN